MSGEDKDFAEVNPGQWVQPVRKGYGMACCDCGLVHRIDFRLAKDSLKRARIQFRAFRDEEATEKLRRGKSAETPITPSAS